MIFRVTSFLIARLWRYWYACMSDSFATLYPLVCLYLRVFINLIKVQFVLTLFCQLDQSYVDLLFSWQSRGCIRKPTLAAFPVVLSHFQLLRDLSMTGQYGSMVRNIMSYEIPSNDRCLHAFVNATCVLGPMFDCHPSAFCPYRLYWVFFAPNRSIMGIVRQNFNTACFVT